MEQTQETNQVTENSQVPESKTVTNQDTETQEQINWKRFREQREIERKEKEAALKRAAEKDAEAQALKAAMEAILNKPSSQSQEYQSEEEISEEEKRAKKFIEDEFSKRERRFEEERRQREQQELPQKLAKTFNDFNQVCSSDNLDYIEYHYPEIARAFQNQPDSFEKWADIYKTVKRFVPNTDSKKEQSKAEKNFNKPQSMAAAGATSVGDGAPMILDDKRRSDNWARMQRIMKGGR